MKKWSEPLGVPAIVQAVEMKRCGVYIVYSLYSLYVAMVPKLVCTLQSSGAGIF